MRLIESKIAEGPKKPVLTDIDRLHNFTVAAAKNDRPKRLGELRTNAVGLLAKASPEDAAELEMDDAHARLAVGLQRCSDYAAQEAVLFEALKDKQDHRVISDLVSLYFRWKVAVDTLRGSYRGLGIPAESWPISATWSAPAKSNREPSKERTIDALIDTPLERAFQEKLTSSTRK